ncbi:hypothetical protein [Herbaspirillum huttiense]|uniref:hypothetical protein n=1 Tax=Herbaspirillum huttiense TaxID=863372 RepID=UPI002176A805|nr:hypothetical protein [Herbaspirillum huttiense]UWE15667.1 hypothetical protein NY669_21680 [Herbaspirillum huttiense]
MESKKPRRKPRGRSGTLFVDGVAAEVRLANLPDEKSQIEQLVADRFCRGESPFRQQIARYGKFVKLEAQPENGIDFRVTTDQGEKWLELAEFAPLEFFEGNYENATGHWTFEGMQNLLSNLIQKKNSKNYGNGVILIVYQTDDRFFIPPPVTQGMPIILANLKISFEAIYCVSPNGTVVEAWPGDPRSQAFAAELGQGNISVGMLIPPKA